jgi:hypothetical protein
MAGIPPTVARVAFRIVEVVVFVGAVFFGCVYLLVPRNESPDRAVRRVQSRISAPGFAEDLASAREAFEEVPEANGTGGVVVCKNGDWIVYATYKGYSSDWEHTFHSVIARDNKGRWYLATSTGSLLQGLTEEHIPLSNNCALFRCPYAPFLRAGRSSWA